MCRFIAYSGPPILMANLLTYPENSLVVQSKQAKKKAKPVNGDGFGIGWYPLHCDPQPGTFVSINPAWNDRNLYSLSSKIKSHCFFAHVRSTSKMSVSPNNCHPFQWGKLLWMHNGRIDHFEKIRRDVISRLSDKAFNFISGTTDSEYAFAIFLDEIKFNDELSTDQIIEALLSTIRHIITLQKQNNVLTNSNMNFCITDGNTVVATRFSTQIKAVDRSLYYNKEEVILSNNNTKNFETSLPSPPKTSLIIASEPLSQSKNIWIKVARNHMIVKYSNDVVKVKKISFVL